MRARNIKPGLCTNELLGSADPLAQLLFCCLPMLADRDGKIEDRPLRIKALIFPYRDVKIESLLAWLEKNGFIERYESNSIKVIRIIGFRKHQSPHHTERSSELPDKQLEYNGSGELTVNTPLMDGGNPPDSLIPDSLIPDSAPAIAATVFSGDGFIVDEKRMSVWESAYPAVDLRREMMAATAWLLANPKNKKSNYDAFLTRWFTKAQDFAPRANQAIKSPDPNQPSADAERSAYEWHKKLLANNQFNLMPEYRLREKIAEYEAKHEANT